MTRRIAFAFSAVLVAFPAGAASTGEIASPSALAASVAAQVIAECDATGARSVAVSVTGAPDLEGAPAVLAAAQALEDRLFTSAKLAPEAPGVADVDVALVLSRVAGRVALGGAVRSRSGRSGWVLASEPETPSWAPWLLPRFPDCGEIGGFTWERVATIAGEVLDADGGDLDGDGLAEFVAATRDEVTVFRLEGGRAIFASRATLAPADDAETATRAPRAFVRVAPGAGGPGDVLLRFTDERRTRVFGWKKDELDPRGERDALVLSARPTARGTELVSMDQLAPGTNHFVDPPRVKRGATWKSPASLGAWLDLRDADLTATARVADSGAAYGLLAGDGLRLLRSDLSEISRVPGCGAAFSLADWDADGKAEALCAGVSSGSSADSLALTTSTGAKWSATVDGSVAAIASGPQADGTAALAFVRIPGGGTSVWLLERRAP